MLEALGEDVKNLSLWFLVTALFILVVVLLIREAFKKPQ